MADYWVSPPSLNQITPEPSWVRLMVLWMEQIPMKVISRVMDYLAVALFMGGICVVEFNPIITIGLWVMCVIVCTARSETNEEYEDVEIN